MPWLPLSLLAYLEPRLDPGGVGFEFGSGGSTLWLAERVGSLTSVEHDPKWHTIIEQELQDSRVGNCRYILREARPRVAGAGVPGVGGVDCGSREWEGSFESYVKVIDQWPDGSLDLVLVDGRSRPACLLHAAPKVRPGGYLILDDTDREHYDEAMRALDAWPRKDFRGARPRFRELSPATCWTRPA